LRRNRAGPARRGGPPAVRGTLLPAAFVALWALAGAPFSLDVGGTVRDGILLGAGLLLAAGRAPLVPARLFEVVLVGAAAVEAVVAVSGWGSGFSRLGGTFTNPNHYAALVGAALAMVAARSVIARSGWSVALSLLGVVGLSGAASLSGSRALPVAVLLVFAFLARYRPSGFSWRRWVVALALVVAAFASMKVTGERLADLAAGREPMAWSRSDLWAGALRVVKSSPVAGVGLGAFGEAWPGVRPERYAGLGSSYAHSEVMQMAAETGLVGLCLFAWLGIALFRTRRAAREAPGAAGALVVVAVFSLVDFALHVPVLAVVAVVAIRALDRGTDAPRTGRRDSPSSRARAFIVAVAAAGVLFLGLDAASGMHCRKAARLAERGDEAGAVAALRSALALMPLNATAAAGLAELDPRGADTPVFLARARWLRPAWMVPLSTAFRRSLEAGDREGAVRLMERAVASDPWGLETRLMKARLFASNGEFGEAARILREAGSVWPANADLWFEKAHLAEAAGRKDEARGILRNILRIRPGSAYARRWLERLER